MTTVVEERSKITTKGQTTVPKAVRQALGVSSGDEVMFVVDDRTGVSLHRVETIDNDPVIDRFLGFLAEDMGRHPDRIVALPEPLARRMTALTEGMTVDPDDAIDGDVAL